MNQWIQAIIQLRVHHKKLMHLCMNVNQEMPARILVKITQCVVFVFFLCVCVLHSVFNEYETK